jgi:hypothetical protein
MVAIIYLLIIQFSSGQLCFFIRKVNLDLPAGYRQTHIRESNLDHSALRWLHRLSKSEILLFLDDYLLQLSFFLQTYAWLFTA